METETEEQKCEFGKGLTYCLGLFLAHTDRLRVDIEKYKEIREKLKAKGEPTEGHFSEDHAASMWMYGAADHIYEFQSDQAPEHLRKRCAKFSAFVMNKRLTMSKEDECTRKDVDWALREAMDLLMEIDKAAGVTVEKGQWE